MNLEEKTKKSNLVFKGHILSVYNDDIEEADGKFSKREIVCHHGGSAVLAIDSDENIYFVEQYRYAYKEVLLEIPAGKLEEKENPIECAKRELLEEIGGSCDKLEELATIYPTPGYCNEKIYIYLAKNVKIGRNHLDEGEFLNIKKIKFSEAKEMVLNGTIKDSKTIISILKYNELK